MQIKFFKYEMMIDKLLRPRLVTSRIILIIYKRLFNLRGEYDYEDEDEVVRIGY